MVSCAVRSCCSRDGVFKKKATGITFHRFPKDPVRREIWEKFVKRGSWKATKCSVLCSKHFTEECFDRTSQCYVRLRDHAIPTALNMEIEIVQSKRGKPVILYLGYRLTLNKVYRNQNKRWTCSTRKCPGNITTDSEISTILKTSDHTCETNVANNEVEPENTPSLPFLSTIHCSPDPNNAEAVIKQEEDTSNAEEFLSVQPDSELYCRLCLCVSQDSNSYTNIFSRTGTYRARQEKIQQMLQNVLPDLDLTLTYNPGICSDCEARLIASYDFILLCTQNQDTLLNYKSKYVEGPYVSIQAVVEANNPTKKRKMTAPVAICKKQKCSLAKDEDMMNESISRNVSDLKSETDNTIENIEIKVEVDPDIYEDSNQPFKTIEGLSEPNVFIQDYNILTQQVEARPRIYETTSRIPVNLGEETDNDVSADHIQPKIEKIDEIQSDVPEFVIVSNVPINDSNRSGIKIEEARTPNSFDSKSDGSNKR